MNTEENTSSGWRMSSDPKSGKTFYHHTKTNETRWKRPPSDAEEIYTLKKRVVKLENRLSHLIDKLPLLLSSHYPYNSK